jgi:hypothetical protein
MFKVYFVLSTLLITNVYACDSDDERERLADQKRKIEQDGQHQIRLQKIQQRYAQREQLHQENMQRIEQQLKQQEEKFEQERKQREEVEIKYQEEQKIKFQQIQENFDQEIQQINLHNEQEREEQKIKDKRRQEKFELRLQQLQLRFERERKGEEIFTKQWTERHESKLQLLRLEIDINLLSLQGENDILGKVAQHIVDEVNGTDFSYGDKTRKYRLNSEIVLDAFKEYNFSMSAQELTEAEQKYAQAIDRWKNVLLNYPLTSGHVAHWTAQRAGAKRPKLTDFIRLPFNPQWFCN